VLRKAVLELERAADRVRPVDEPSHLVERPPAERQVELVRLLRELRRAFERAVVDLAHARDHVERAPEVLERRRRLLQVGRRRARCTTAVASRPPSSGPTARIAGSTRPSARARRTGRRAGSCPPPAAPPRPPRTPR